MTTPNLSPFYKTQPSPAIPEDTSKQYTTFIDREVVVIVPFGNFNDAKELGRYRNYEVAYAIITVLNLPEYKMFYLDTGEEVKPH